jgi:hypothetical protein
MALATLSIEELIARYFQGDHYGFYFNNDNPMHTENELIDRVERAPSLAGLLQTARGITDETFRTHLLDTIMGQRLYEFWDAPFIAHDKLDFLEREMQAYLAYAPAADDDLRGGFFRDMPRGRAFLATVHRLQEERRVAVAMGAHTRLGSGGQLSHLDPYLLAKIMDSHP